MNVKELRIGNLVTVNNPDSHPKLKGVTLEVTSIHESGNREGYTHGVGLQHINQIQNRYYETYSQFVRFIEPIPLTEEWLLKFGFKKHKSDIRFYQNGCLNIKTHQNGFQFRWSESLVYIAYVHQLQNIYFCLSGNELKLNQNV